MGLLVTPYDPTGAARVLIAAQQQGQAAQLAQQQQAIDLAKSVADARRHEIEFARTLAFNEAKEANDEAKSFRTEGESRRRYDLENEPFVNPFAKTASPAAALPVDTSSPIKGGEVGSEGMSDPFSAQQDAVDAGSLPVPPADTTLQTPAGRAATRTLPVDQGALPVAGASPTDNPLIEGAKSKLSVLGQILAEGGVSKKKATNIIAEAGRNLIAPARAPISTLTAPKVKTSYVDPDTGTVHTQFTSGAWDTPPEDASRLRPLGKAPIEERGTRFVNADTGEQYVMKPNGMMVDADGEPVNPENAQRLQKIGSQSAAREKLAETKQTTAVDQKAADVKAKSEKEAAAAKAKLVEQERVNLRTYRQQRKAIKPDPDGQLRADALLNANAIDKQIIASEQRLAAMGAKEDDTSVPSLSSKAEFDALPSGAEYIRDGKRYRKP